MKILGVGVDLVKNIRMKEILEKSYKSRFITKILHPKQVEFFFGIEHEQYQIQYLASRWAVKEAAVKAIGRRELLFPGVNITKNENGKPSLELTGSINQSLMKEVGVSSIMISMAHEDQYTVAFAMALAAI